VRNTGGVHVNFCAQIIGYEDLMRAGSNVVAREPGLMRLEGKDYIMQEGDVVHFRFNV
jgi:ribosome-binding ATPase YchF (GTP1/OBG family)